MPTYTKKTLRVVQTIISKSLIRINAVGKSSLVATLVTALIITSLWTTTTQAEAPDPFASDAKMEEVLVDGLTVKERAAKIDAFYISKGDLPLAGHGLAFVQAADKYGIDWRLVASIGYHESTGGKFACKKVKFSAFGWGSCKINFSSYEESIDVISKNLGGDNPNTARYYAGKTTKQIIDVYNPDHIRKDYDTLVLGTMEKIAKIDAPTILAMK
jgi:hypothetical protein